MDWISQINAFHKNLQPFFCVLSFDKKENFVCPLNELEKYQIKCHTPSSTERVKKKNEKKRAKVLTSFPISFPLYEEKFLSVQKQIRQGNTYLLNLTFPTKIEIEQSLEDIYESCTSKYKILFKNKFVSFSPETFVTLEGNYIHTTPMKGTIDSSLPNAKKHSPQR